jgi:hypothetical protein
MTYRIFHGAAKPIIARGKHQCRLLEFLEKNKGWHSINRRCKATIKAMVGLEKKGCVEVLGEQCRFIYPK